ncbi:MAG: DNA polymerase [Candidatus Heimdallarchaeaceae archaeon]
MKVGDCGPPSANIMLIGEAPGESEERVGRPFVGASGKLLKHMLLHAGISFDDCYVTNVVNERPPNNDFGYYYEQKSRKIPKPALEDCWKKLRQKVRDIRPNVVVAIGAEALRALTGEKSITPWRGTIMLFDGIKVIPIFHPASVLRNYNQHVIVEMDLQKVFNERFFPEYKKPYIETITSPTFKQVIDWLSDIDKYLSFDIETIDRQVRCLGFAKLMPDGCISSICIPFMKFASSSMTSLNGSKYIRLGNLSNDVSSYWSVDLEVAILNKIEEVFNDDSIEVIGQNSVSFDCPLIKGNFGIVIKNNSFDTMHAWHVLYPELNKSLSFLCSILTDYQNYWTHKIAENDESEWFYNCMDTIVTLDVYFKIKSELEDKGLTDFYRNFIHKLAEVMVQVEDNGVLIDVETRDELKIDIEKQLSIMQSEIDTIAKKHINCNSSPQIKRLLYDTLRFPKVMKDNKVTVDEDALRALLKKYPKEAILQLIIQIRKARKLISTYLNVPVDADNRMRTSYNVSGTKSGRLSSSKTVFGTGLNLQNIPAGRSAGVENIRNLFIAPEGCMLVRSDFKQAETMVVAHILKRCGDSTLYDKYKDSNFDIHKWAASFIYDKPESEITKKERAVGKLRNHAGNYGSGPRVLVSKANKEGIDGITYKTAKRIIELGHKNVPGIRVWWKSVEDQLRKTRTLRNCFGRIRTFFGRLDSTTFRDAYSWEPQSTVGDVCNMMIVNLSTMLDDDCKIILQVHDEIVVECPIDKTQLVMDKMKKASLIELNILEGDPLIIPIELSIGKNWRDCKDAV